MMKKPNQLSISSLVNNADEERLLGKFGQLLDNAVPKNILGMLATAKILNNGSIVFFDRFHLNIVDKNNYNIYDTKIDDTKYTNISLFLSAVNMIYAMHKNIFFMSAPKESVIYNLDQEYGRCLWNTKFFKYKLGKATNEKMPIYADKLTDSRLRLRELKTKIFKVI